MKVEKEIINTLSDLLYIKKENISLDSKIEDLGADELDKFEVVMAIENDFGILIDDEEIEKIQTVKELVECVEKKIRS